MPPFIFVTPPSPYQLNVHQIHQPEFQQLPFHPSLKEAKLATEKETTPINVPIHISQIFNSVNKKELKIPQKEDTEDIKIKSAVTVNVKKPVQRKEKFVPPVLDEFGREWKVLEGPYQYFSEENLFLFGRHLKNGLSVVFKF